MIPDEYTIKINAKAEELGLDYRLYDLVVSLKGDRGTISVARGFECSHIPGNYEKYDKNKHKLIGF